jgi:hypothetical protein
MKALKVLGYIVGAIGLAIFVFWFGWLRAPAAQDVCDNVAKLMKKESGSDMPAEFMKACIDEYAKEPEFGRVPWVAQLKCIEDADSLADLEKCEKR